MEELLGRLASQAAAAPPLVTLLLVFFGGILSSASPCVLAAVPLVVATVGGTATSRRRTLTLTLAFVTGLAVCFTALGAAAALTGTLLGSVGTWWKILLSALLIAFGLHLSGLVRIPMPTVDPARFRAGGVAGAFALGALTGTLSSPCATPILVAILSLVAFEKKILWGTTLLLAYSIGHVVLLFVAGTVTGFVTVWAGSRAALWADRLHRAFGWVLVAAGAWIGATELRLIFEV
jgi:cytochrome c biogenesis protein CcdA